MINRPTKIIRVKCLTRKPIHVKNASEIAVLRYQKRNLTKNYGYIRKNVVIHDWKNVKPRHTAATDRVVTQPPLGKKWWRATAATASAAGAKPKRLLRCRRLKYYRLNALPPPSHKLLVVFDRTYGHCWVLVYWPKTNISSYDTRRLYEALEAILIEHKIVTILSDFNMHGFKWRCDFHLMDIT